MFPGMGFTAIAATASTVASVLPKAMQAQALRQQGKSLKAAASAQEQLANRQADAMAGAAQENQRRGARNAQAQLAEARTDAAASNLAADGTAYVREQDMATRLQDEIANAANATLQQADTVRRQGQFDAWNTRQAARQARAQAYGSGFSAIGSLFSGIASGLNQPSAMASKPKK